MIAYLKMVLVSYQKDSGTPVIYLSIYQYDRLEIEKVINLNLV